jgi:hypothetical protein
VVDAAHRLRGSSPAGIVRVRSQRTPRRAIVARAHGVTWGVAAGGASAGGGGGHSRARRCVCGAAGDDDANLTAGEATASPAGDTLSALDATLGIDVEADAVDTPVRADAAVTGTGDAAASSSSSSRTKAGDTLSALDAMLGIDPEAEAAEKAAAAAAEAARQKRRQEAEAARTAALPREKRMGTVQVGRYASASPPFTPTHGATQGSLFPPPYAQTLCPSAGVGQAGWEMILTVSWAARRGARMGDEVQNARKSTNSPFWLHPPGCAMPSFSLWTRRACAHVRAR